MTDKPNTPPSDGRAKLKTRVASILIGALSGDENRYKTGSGFTRWGVVEEDIKAAIDEAWPVAQSESEASVIRCVWVVEREFGYGKAMRVVASDHPRFTVGSRFDFGFLNIAVSEGYRVQIDPVPPHVLHDIEEARREREAQR